jgi:N-acetylmuramoyl-L-alanine amidase CwlA
MKIKESFIPERPKRKLTSLKGIIVHWTANTRAGAGADAHLNYFKNNWKIGCTHYVVDDKEIIYLIPDDEVAYHVGDRERKSNLPIRKSILSKGGGPNDFLIGIEMCVNSDNDWAKTLQNVKELLHHLFEKHNLTIDNVHRHFDISGKDCPFMYQPQLVNEKHYDWSWITFKEYMKNK